MDKIVVFLHIPKTGGTSMLRTMWDMYGKDHVIAARPWYQGKEKLPGGTKALLGHVPWGIHRRLGKRKYVYTTMLRHPASRLLSEYHYRKILTGGGREKCRSLGMYDGMPLDEYVLLDLNTLDNPQVRQLAGMPFMDAERGIEALVTATDYKRALRHVQKFAAVGITEEYALSLKCFAGALGWSEPTMYHEKTVSHPTIDQIDQDIVDTILERNQYDIKLYDKCRMILHS